MDGSALFCPVQWGQKSMFLVDCIKWLLMGMLASAHFTTFPKQNTSSSTAQVLHISCSLWALFRVAVVLAIALH